MTSGKKTEGKEKATAPSRRSESGISRKAAKEQARIAIIEAVGRVLSREGMPKTTVEAIAEESGMSKGGILHYFPSKKSLLYGLIELYEKRFRERHAKLIAKLPPSKFVTCKAAAMIMLDDMDRHPDEVPNMSSILDDPDLRRRVGELKRRTYKQAIHGLDNPAAASLVFYVIDGLWMDIRFDPMVIPKKDRKAAIKELLQYIDSLENRNAP